MRTLLISLVVPFIFSSQAVPEDEEPMTLERYLEMPLRSNRQMLAGFELVKNSDKAFLTNLVKKFRQGEIETYVLLDLFECAASRVTDEMIQDVLDENWERAQQSGKFGPYYTIAHYYGSGTEADRILDALALDYTAWGLVAIYSVGTRADLSQVLKLNERLILEKKISKLILQNTLKQLGSDPLSNFETLTRRLRQGLLKMSDEERNIYFTFKAGFYDPDLWDSLRNAMNTAGGSHSLNYAKRNIIPESLKSSYEQLLTECFPEDVLIQNWFTRRKRLRAKSSPQHSPSDGR